MTNSTTDHEFSSFLRHPTPKAWINTALEHVPLLLIDHAHCEKKAASSALSLIYRYPDKPDLLQKMSRLAREELRHFERVIQILQKRNIDFVTISASRYPSGLRQHVRQNEPEKLIDNLIVGAFIEARSCERFAAIADYLDEEIATFYKRLLASESRHFKDYLQLAEKYSDKPIDDRVEFFAEVESELIITPDEQFRFHSGVPASTGAQ